MKKRLRKIIHKYALFLLLYLYMTPLSATTPNQLFSRGETIYNSTQAMTTVDPDNQNIVYWGRVDFSNPKAPAFTFPGITIRAKFTGTSISAKIYEYARGGATTTNYYYIIVDGGSPVKLKGISGDNIYPLASGLSPGSHTIELVKLTESNVGRAAFKGFLLDNGQTLLPLTNEPTCKIEFIGNSITCGYGNEAVIQAPPAGNPTTGFHSVNENNYKAWGYVTARNLNMSYRAVAYSGRGLYRNNTGSTTGTLPDIYDRIFPDDPASPTWNHTADHPDYIVINLGTNDFALDPGTPVDQTRFESAYVNFVKRLKGYHPNATIILTTGVMMSDNYPSGAQTWTRINLYVKNVVTTLNSNGYSKVYSYKMNPQSGPYGEDWHPSAATHAAMANGLTSFIKSLGISCIQKAADCNGDISGTAYTDICGVCVGGKSSNLPCIDSLQAENACTVDGIKSESSSSGYSGSGYVNTDNFSGASVSWVLNSTSAQVATLTFRYANGGSNSRYGQIYINGTSETTVSFPTTGSWTSWKKASVNMTLNGNVNNILLSATTSEGLPNLDLIYYSAGISEGLCVITGIPSNSDLASQIVYPSPTRGEINWMGEQNWILRNIVGIEMGRGTGTSADLSTYPNGIYLLRLGEKIFPIIKE